jgi:hypothetical protein
MTKEGVEKFWMVSVTGGGPSFVRHEKRADAIAEAKRLTRKTGGRSYILEAITAYEMPPTTLIEIDLAPLQKRPDQTAPLRFSPTTGADYSDRLIDARQWRDEYLGISWRYDPWTGERRDPLDVTADPYGAQITPQQD